MPNPHLVEHIRSRLGQGATPEVIKSSILTAGGWQASEIDEALQSVNAPGTHPAPDPAPIAPQFIPPIPAPSVTPPPTFIPPISVPPTFVPPTATTPTFVPPTFVPSPETVASPTPAPKHSFLPLKSIIALVVLLVLGGIFSFVYGIGPFSSKMYTEDNFFSGLLMKSSEIKASTYRGTITLNTNPRDGDAEPFDAEPLENPELKKRYENDDKRARDLEAILRSLQPSYYSNKTYPPYPSSLSQLMKDQGSASSYYAIPSITDPRTGSTYEYKTTKGGQGFALTTTFETGKAVSAVRNYYGYTATGTPISGRTVTFTEESGSPYLYLSDEPPKPLLVTLAEWSKYAPPELSLSFSAGASADWRTSDWSFNADATGDFGDLMYKVNVDALKKGSDYYLKINNMPSFFLFSTLASYKGSWIKLDTEGDANDPYDGLSYLTNSISESEKGLKENRENLIALLRKAAEIADEYKVASFRTSPRKDKVDNQTFTRYEIAFKKDAILPFYKKLQKEFEGRPEFAENNFLLDEGMIDYLESDYFDEVFDYVNKNTFITLWVDDHGFPRILEYRMRLVPPGTATNLREKQVDLVAKITLDNINEEIEIDAPKNAKTIDEIVEENGDDPYISSLSAARSKGSDAKTKAQLSGARAAAELYYDRVGSYGASTMVKPASICSGKMFTDAQSSMATYVGTPGTYPEGTTFSCQATTMAYAVSASLSGTDGQDYWCIDSTGNSKLSTAHLTQGDTSCD